jgi:hypothetical protein
MTSIGTSVAASVAQTALNAQQTARQRDKVHGQSARDAKRLHEMLEASMQALEEGDGFESPAQLHVGGEVPQQRQQQQGRDAKPPRKGDADTPADAPETASTSTPTTAPDGSLYRHLDVQA